MTSREKVGDRNMGGVGVPEKRGGERHCFAWEMYIAWLVALSGNYGSFWEYTDSM